MSFRAASMADAELLHRWRLTDEQTVNYPIATPLDSHLYWLGERLAADRLIHILIWEKDGEPSGMVRIDSNGELAFHGDDPEMIKAATEYATRYGGRLKAVVDADDPKIQQLEQAGFKRYPSVALCFRSDA